MYATMGEMLRAAARRFGDREFLIAPDRILSFAEVDQLADQAAAGLASLGIGQADKVTLWVENGWRWLVAYYGVLKLGAIVNPVNILLTAEEVAYIARDCGAKAVIAAAEKVALLTDRLAVPVIADRFSEQRSISLDALLMTAGRFPEPSVAAKDPAAICYTSGTTGHPKGAMLRHSTIVMNTMMTSLMHARSASDTVVSALPCPHVYGNIVMNSAIACGSRLVLLPRFDESAVFDAIERHAATVFDGVPTMYLKMLNHPQRSRAKLSTLRLCTVGGQTMPTVSMEEVEQTFGCRLIELWGMTELGGLGTTHPHNGPRRLGSIGIPLPLSFAKVVDVNDPTREVSVGTVGELMIRGPLVMAGYYNNPEATLEAIEPEGWLHTGDLVRQDAEGYLYVMDRKKEVIINGGYNVYPAEVERVLAQHPAVAIAAVAALKDALKGQVPKAFVVLRPGAACSSEELIDHCKAALAAYKVPRAVEFLPDLPKTSTGKILRRALADSTL